MGRGVSGALTSPLKQDGGFGPQGDPWPSCRKDAQPPCGGLASVWSLRPTRGALLGCKCHPDASSPSSPTGAPAHLPSPGEVAPQASNLGGCLGEDWIPDTHSPQHRGPAPPPTPVSPSQGGLPGGGAPYVAPGGGPPRPSGIGFQGFHHNLGRTEGQEVPLASLTSSGALVQTKKPPMLQGSRLSHSSSPLNCPHTALHAPSLARHGASPQAGGRQVTPPSPAPVCPPTQSRGREDPKCGQQKRPRHSNALFTVQMRELRLEGEPAARGPQPGSCLAPTPTPWGRSWSRLGPQ